MSHKFYNPFMPDLAMRPDGMVFGGGGKGAPAPVQTPVYTPPPAAPTPAAPPATVVTPAGASASSSSAIQDDAVSQEEETQRKKRAMKVGAKSLQIPTQGVGGTSTVGTGTGGSSGNGRS